MYRVEHEQLAEALKKLREKSGLTQRDLAKKLGKPQSFVAKIELGMQPIYVWEFYDWCEAVETEPPTVLSELSQ